MHRPDSEPPTTTIASVRLALSEFWKNNFGVQNPLDLFLNQGENERDLNFRNATTAVVKRMDQAMVAEHLRPALTKFDYPEVNMMVENYSTTLIDQRKMQKHSPAWLNSSRLLQHLQMINLPSFWQEMIRSVEPLDPENVKKMIDNSHYSKNRLPGMEIAARNSHTLGIAFSEFGLALAYGTNFQYCLNRSAKFNIIKKGEIYTAAREVSAMFPKPSQNFGEFTTRMKEIYTPDYRSPAFSILFDHGAFGYGSFHSQGMGLTNAIFTEYAKYLRNDNDMEILGKYLVN